MHALCSCGPPGFGEVGRRPRADFEGGTSRGWAVRTPGIRGRGRVFRDSGPRRWGVLRGRQKAGSSGEQKEGRAKRELWGWGFQRSRS